MNESRKNAEEKIELVKKEIQTNLKATQKKFEQFKQKQKQKLKKIGDWEEDDVH